jgi:hypothetical protein
LSRSISCADAQEPDPPHPLALLRPRRERPCSSAAEQRDEGATFHSMTSSARPTVALPSAPMNARRWT